MASLCTRRSTLVGSVLARQKGLSPPGLVHSPSLTDGVTLPKRWSVIVAQKRYLHRHRVAVDELKNAYLRAKEMSHKFEDQGEGEGPEGV